MALSNRFTNNRISPSLQGFCSLPHTQLLEQRQTVCLGLSWRSAIQATEERQVLGSRDVLGKPQVLRENSDLAIEASFWNRAGRYVCGNILVRCDSLGQPTAPAEAL
jgi:hypothetical protein